MEMLEHARTTGYGRTPCIDVAGNQIELTAEILRAIERDEARDSAAVVRLAATSMDARPA